MIARELVNDSIPPLKLSDTGLKALNWMEEFRVEHLAIVDGVMRTHAGTVQVSQATLGGADFILRWPQEMPATVHLVTNGHPTSTEHTKARS